MEQIAIYVALLGIIVIIGMVFHQSRIPISLILVITGILGSYFVNLPNIELKPDLVLNVFLPLLLYQISSFSSWRDVKRDMRAIGLLSVGHVLFITLLVAVIVHWIIPGMSWPLAFVLGAVISPPDDVAIVSIAEKIRMPRRIMTILEGEGMLNDAAALILFRFALVAVVTHEFFLFSAIGTFFIVVIGEILYGLILGNLLGQLRLKIQDPILHMLASVITPFLAYLPAEALGGCGVIATVATGFVIGNKFSIRFTPEFRLISRAVWPTLAYAIQNFLFLLLGLNIKFVLTGISNIPILKLSSYTAVVVLTVIVGRFIWVYPSTYLPRYLFSSIRKRDPSPPWQYPFIVSWAGMRGGISLAAALAVPSLPLVGDGVNIRDLLIFMVFAVIVATLIFQGLTLPWFLKVLGIRKHSEKEKKDEYLAELTAKVKMINAVIKWLKESEKLYSTDKQLLAELKVQIKSYQVFRRQIKEKLENQSSGLIKLEKKGMRDVLFLSAKIIEIQREELLRLWRKEYITHSIRDKLLSQLDHHEKHFLS